MEAILLPNPVQITYEGNNRYTLSLEPLHPGYGVTIGNAMRRILLSSLPGSAVTAVKIKFADHEFSTIPHVKEDVIQVILNLKQIRIKSQSVEPVRLHLNVKGEKVVTAADIEKSDQIEVLSPDAVIATLDSKSAELDMEIIVEQGRGYVPVEGRDSSRLEVGFLAVDAIFTPVKSVFYDVSNVRVGQLTNYDKLTLVIETNGTITGEEASNIAAQILVDHFNLMISEAFKNSLKTTAIEPTDEVAVEAAIEDVGSNDEDFADLILSTRAKNALIKAGITGSGKLMALSAAEIENIEGLGKKTVQEILTAIGKA
ncbi:MAG TPA: DNA-directed RNA polymerase subunit alpha [Patescibacteria group bacterium]|nr:DNA-directed RNA polymerase subunit alpha [Patescibacteria group bacterium]